MCVGDIKEVFFIEVEFDKDLNELAGLGQKVAQVSGPNLTREQEGEKKKNNRNGKVWNIIREVISFLFGQKDNVGSGN